MPCLKVLCVRVPLAALLLAVPALGSPRGWYMLTPPVIGRGAPVVDVTAPLPRWRPSPLYESARECEEIRLKWVASLKRFEGSMRRTRALNARCIAATDPRLTPESTSASSQAGWYLLIPPPRKEQSPSPSEPAGSQSSTERADPPTPIPQWSHYRSFDTEAECDAARRDLESGADKVPKDRAEGACISISDRRLISGATTP